MKRLLLFCVLCLFLLPLLLKGQQVRLLALNELEQRFSQGKDTTYVVNFWATWCVPCVAELPHFEKLQLEHGNEPVKVLLVSLDFKSKLETAVKPFAVKNHLKNEVFLLNETDQQEYIDRVSKDWSGAIPATLIVNQGKNVRKFYEQEFTLEELEKIYQSLK